MAPFNLFKIRQSLQLIPFQLRQYPTESLIPSISPEQITTAATDIDISNWKTYTNSKYDFTFKYPSNWIENGDSFEEKIGDNDVNVFSQKGISVMTYENAGSLNALEFLDTIFYKDYINQGSKSLKEAYMKQYRENSLLKSVTIDGKPFTLIEELIEPHGSNGRGIWITINKNGLLLRSYPSADSENQQKIFNQILSTFKFKDTTANQINLTLPTGWTKSVEQAVSPFDETDKYERTVLVKGNYKIEIGDPVGGGRANCDTGVPAPSILNNLSLSSKVKRTNYSKYSFDALTAQVCSNFVSEDYLDYGTKIGRIEYMLPSNWDKTVLKEMDSIVESITLVK